MDDKIYPIPGYEGLYGITRGGRIWSYRKWRNYEGRWMDISDNGGRKSVSLTKNKQSKHWGIDSLLRITFQEIPEGMREIPGTDGNYLISKDGEVFSMLTHKMLAPTPGKYGERVVTVPCDGGRKTINVRTTARRIFHDLLPAMKPVAGTNGKYGVTRDGRIYSYITGKFLIGFQGGTSPYLRVKLSDGEGNAFHKSIHRIVAETYLPNPYNLPQVDHINGDEWDNRVENLEWVTGKENTDRAFCRRRILNGEEIQYV